MRTSYKFRITIISSPIFTYNKILNFILLNRIVILKYYYSAYTFMRIFYFINIHFINTLRFNNTYYGIIIFISIVFVILVIYYRW